MKFSVWSSFATSPKPSQVSGRKRRTLAATALAVALAASPLRAVRAEPAPLPLTAQPRALRLQAAKDLATDRSAAGLVSLWLLAHDADLDVVGRALAAALTRCKAELPSVCQAALAFFVDGKDDAPAPWQHRSQALAAEPLLARQLAARETKLEVVNLLAGRLSQGQPPRAWLAALDVLAHDQELEVQEAALALQGDLDQPES